MREKDAFHLQFAHAVAVNGNDRRWSPEPPQMETKNPHAPPLVMLEIEDAFGSQYHAVTVKHH